MNFLLSPEFRRCWLLPNATEWTWWCIYVQYGMDWFEIVFSSKKKSSSSVVLVRCANQPIACDLTRHFLCTCLIGLPMCCIRWCTIHNTNESINQYQSIFKFIYKVVLIKEQAAYSLCAQFIHSFAHSLSHRENCKQKRFAKVILTYCSTRCSPIWPKQTEQEISLGCVCACVDRGVCFQINDDCQLIMIRC